MDDFCRKKKLINKKVLLFCQYFFGYENHIKKKMEEMGAEVHLYNEISVKTTFGRALLKISSQLFYVRTERYYLKILEKEQNNLFDFILFIDCEMPTENELSKYRKAFENAKFCLHLWDSMRNLKGVEKKFGFFDYITTFDRKDAEKYRLIFRPLFFSDEYRIEDNAPPKYDLLFIGTIHSDRYKIIKKICSQVDVKKVYIYPYLQSKFIYIFYKLTKAEFRTSKMSDFKFRKKDTGNIISAVKQSRAIIDIQHPGQSGLTMRTIEMLGMNKKIITTNEDIVNYDFYNPTNILIINRRQPKINQNFLKTKYHKLPIEIYEKYSIESWIIDVLGISI